MEDPTPPPPPTEPGPGTSFTVDLTQIELTDDEVNSLNNEITRLAVESVQRNRSHLAAKTRGEAYAKIIFVKSVPTPQRT